MTSRRWILWLLMFATAVAMQAGTSTALASCGDYLIGHAGQHAMPLADAAAMEPDSEPMPRKVPCNGPGCQKAPTDPISQAPAKISLPEHENVACTSAKLSLPNAERPRSGIELHEPQPVGHPQGIEHPPRA